MKRPVRELPHNFVGPQLGGGSIWRRVAILVGKIDSDKLEKVVGLARK